MMSRKFMTISCALVLVGVIGASSVLAITPKGKERLRKIAVTTQGYALQTPSDGYATPPQNNRIPSIAADYSGTPMGGFSAVNNPPSINSGLIAGRTYYDYQHNGSTGRRVVTRGLNNCISCAWMNQDNNSASLGRNIRYNGYDPTGGFGMTDPNGVDVLWAVADRAGYTSIDATDDAGHAAVVGHYNPTFPTGNFGPFVGINGTTCFSDFLGNFLSGTTVAAAEAIYSCYKQGTGNQFIWPRIAVTNNAGTKVMHVLMQGDDGGDEGYIVYTRNTTFPFSSVGPWSNGLIVGSSGFQSYDIAASRTTNKVVIAWAGGRGTVDNTVAPFKCVAFGGSGRPAGLITQEDGSGAGQQDNDLNYVTSLDAGATWSNIQNVTQYPSADGGGFRVHATLSALITSDNVTHIAFSGEQWVSKSGPFRYRSRIFHWDDTQPKGFAGTGIRTAVAAEWDPTTCNAGVFKLNVCNPQLAECEGKLFITFESYADITKDPTGPSTSEGDDCSARASSDPTGAADGDVYLTVSSNGGYNWDVARPAMYSYTPNCDKDTTSATKADCEGAAWSTTIAYGIIQQAGQDFSGVPDMTAGIDPTYSDNEYLFSMYVDDLDPGGAIRPEGAWTYNDLKLFRMGCVDPVTKAVYSPSYSSIDEPAYVLPGVFKDSAWTINNFGNADLIYSATITTLTGTAGNVKFSDGTTVKSGTVSSGAINSTNFTLRLNSTSSAVVQNCSARIRVIFNTVSLLDVDTADHIINYPIANIQQLDYDSIASSILFGNNANFGREQNFTGTQTIGGVNMDFMDEAGCECDTTVEHYVYDASPLISIDKGAPLNNIVISGMYNYPNYWDSTMFRPLDNTSQNPCGVAYTRGYSGRAVNQDTTVAVMVEYYYPTTPISVPAGACAKYTWVKVALTGTSATLVDSVYLSYAMDGDVPSDSGSRNSSTLNASAGRQLLYMSGYETVVDTGNGACTPADKRWWGINFMTDAGTAAAYDGTTGSRNIKTKKAMYTRDQATYLGGASGWDERKIDSALHALSGTSVFSSPAPESAFVDLHAVLNGGAYRVNNADTVYMWFQMYSGYNMTNAQWLAYVDAARALPTPVCGGCCDLAGDADNDASVTIGDAVYLIGYIFLGGGAPPCDKEGDADGDASITIGDAVYLIGYIFLGGGAPVCGP